MSSACTYSGERSLTFHFFINLLAKNINSSDLRTFYKDILARINEDEN